MGLDADSLGIFSWFFESISIQRTGQKSEPGRRGHDPALRNGASDYNLLSQTDMHILF